ncbi:hypothetical protein KUTeg_006574 [Tegillarca granosa]|uniref:C-type lectin domain-containing protein n=1 Tax=Tegillarca granosa TaxID=220873 RepID=A0ABQ9FAM7_TEGGR|nr:hypothetical protein KUTeg_006574 [Tegillarca granosa]
MDAKDEESENHWYWDWTGQPLGYTNWYPNEPSNTGDKENCLGTHKGGIWNDYPCNSHCHAICEKECGSSTTPLTIINNMTKLADFIVFVAFATACMRVSWWAFGDNQQC